jgi:DNA-binding CsgD family transcriptional regulator
MAAGPVDNVFIGREAELGRVADVVDKVRGGQPWLVTIEGESGIGKTALARQVLASSLDAAVLLARGDPSETDLQFGIVQQLMLGVDRAILAQHPLLTEAVAGSSPFAVGAELLALVGAQLATGPMVMIIDDVQWADGPSIEAISFMLRRFSVDPILVMVVIRGDREQLDETTARMLLSLNERVHIRLSGLSLDDLPGLAAAVGATPLDPGSARRLFERTHGHTLYLRTILSDPESVGRLESEDGALPRPLAAAIGDQLTNLSVDTRSALEMLAVLNSRIPLALLGDAAGVASASAAIEPAVGAGLVDWWPQEPTCPVTIRHALQRDSIYARMSPRRRRELHARAVSLVDDREAWAHRVASLDRPDERLARRLERSANREAGRGHLATAATHLLWASDISPARADRERRMLDAALHLMLVSEARGLELRAAAQAAARSPLRSSVLGTMAFSSGRLGEAELRFSEALSEARADPENRLLAAVIANRLAGTYTLLGDGEKVMTFARWALDTGCLGPAVASQTRTLVAVGASQVSGPLAAMAELSFLDADPARVDPIHVDGLSFRGVFRFVSGDLQPAIADLTASLKMVREGAAITLGLRAYCYLALAQYFAGAWDDALLTSEQALSASAIHTRHFELPLLHLAACCVPAGRGLTEEAARRARLAEQAAASLDYGQEALYAGMARALVCQAAGDYRGVADALDHWLDDKALDGRSRVYEVIWRPILIEGLIGAGRYEDAAGALDSFQLRAGSVTYLQPALAWLNGWLAEQQKQPEKAHELYQFGEDTSSTDSPLYHARLLLAHGRLLRRTGQRRLAIDRLRRAHDLFQTLQAGPFMSQAEEEMAQCGLRPGTAARRSVLELTNRESEVAHLVEQRLTNGEIAAELFITPKAVEYHLGNIYSKFGIKGRQQLRQYLSQVRRPEPV